jgi:MFS family permease
VSVVPGEAPRAAGSPGALSFYGWSAIVPAAFLILLVTNGLTTGGIAAFDPSFIQQLGVARADVKFGDALQLGITALITVLTGWIADRYGVRPVMAAGLAALAWGFYSLGGVETIGDYYAARLWMGVGLAAAGLAICVTLTSRWFLLRRGLALGMVLAGTSLGNAVFPLLFTRLIANQGLAQAGLVAAVMILALYVVVLLLVREWPQDRGLKPYGAERYDPTQSAQALAGPELSYGQILGRREFWLMGIAAFCTFFTILGVNGNMILHVQNLGGGIEYGAKMAMPLFFAGLIGKLGAGWLTDIFGRRPVWLVCLALMLVAAGMLTTLSLTLVPFAAFLMGLGWGANYTLLQAVASDLFGTRSLGRVMGAVTVLDAGGGALGPWITAEFADSSGNYQTGFGFITALLVVAFICAALLRVRTPDSQVRSP